jgi:5'-methylthioadenosine phosphorylase
MAARDPVPGAGGAHLAVIGGSGAHQVLAASQQLATRLGPVETPFGDSAPLYRIRKGDAHFLFLPRHGETGYEVAAPWVNYRANIYALKEHQVTRIVSWSGPGAIDASLRVGQFVIPSDLIDATHGREGSFYKGTGLGFLRQTPVFCLELRETIESALHLLRLDYRVYGVYVCTQGPRLETPAEIKVFRKDGADLVGMTLAPEAFLARELEMCYAPLCYVTNFAEGVYERDLRPGELFAGLISDAEREAVDQAVSRFVDIACLVARNLPLERRCPCGLAMERYRKEGRIGTDWHTWLGKP